MEPGQGDLQSVVEQSADNRAGPPTTVYFCADFDVSPDHARTFSGRNSFPAGRYYRTFDNVTVPQPIFGSKSAQSGPLNNRIGALFTWNDSQPSMVKSRVGVSFISAEKACTFKSEELRTWNLEDSAQAARDEWNQGVLGKVRVSTDSSANKTRLALLYSSLYFMHLIPSERSGENPLWDSGEPYWDDFYTLCKRLKWIDTLQDRVLTVQGTCFATPSASII